jgi:dihydrofolate reductase
MANRDSRVIIHMATSLDGFIARKDGRVDWLETADEFIGGASLDPSDVEAFLKTIDGYVMGSRTYDTALGFEARGVGWSYGDKLHLAEVKAYDTGIVELRYDVRENRV